MKGRINLTLIFKTENIHLSKIDGNILLICRHEILGWSLGVTILYCIYTVCEGFLTKWRENADFLIPMLQIISHCSISSLAVPWLCSLVPALTILSSGELIPAARFRSCSISSLAVPWLGSLVPDLTFSETRCGHIFV